jgi:hypothetical protein
MKQRAPVRNPNGSVIAFPEHPMRKAAERKEFFSHGEI